eukprot:jgi/Galph1/5063/GphlegSOOS_G3773.1
MSARLFMDIMTHASRDDELDVYIDTAATIKLPHEELQDIEYYWTQLEPHLKYLSPKQLSVVEEALKVAYDAHKNQKRHSGDPFIIHPIAVAIILADLKMDRDTIVAGLLHDTVEDTGLTFERVEEQFGMDVRRIVEGETKVSKLPKMADIFIDEQAENLRQLFIAMTEDWRIIMVKLADRLHNMRTLQFMTKKKREKIARETLDIFAPLAHRLGIWQIKSELESLGFMYLYPSEYEETRMLVEKKLPKYTKVLEESRKALEEALKNDVILQQSVALVEVSARTKELYSLWKKMCQNGRTIEEVYDLVALRVLITPKPLKIESHQPHEMHSEQTLPTSLAEEDWSQRMIETLEKSLCYYTLGIVHSMWQPFPCRVKDYIAFPKENGYQSLHTTVMAGGAQAPLEVQIRTLEMHLVAQYGMAAHWIYKNSDFQHLTKTTRWMSSIVEWGDEIRSSREFVELVRRELLGSRVFVFAKLDTNPDQSLKIFNLPRGSCIIDVAFQLDSQLGLGITSARVNGKSAPLYYQMENADVVSIVCSASGCARVEWLDHVKTRIAKRQLHHYFESWRRKQLYEQGFEYLKSYLESFGIALSSFEQWKENEIMQWVSLFTNYTNLEEFCIHLSSTTADERMDELKEIVTHINCIGYPWSRESHILTEHRIVSSSSDDVSQNDYYSLQVICEDRNGLLSEVSAIISESYCTILETKSISLGKQAILEYLIQMTNGKWEEMKCLLFRVVGVLQVKLEREASRHDWRKT